MVQITYGLIGICLLLMVFTFITDSISKKRKRLLFLMAFTAMMLLFTDRFARLYDGSPTVIDGYIVRISKFFAYWLNLVIVYIFTQYLKDLLRKEGHLDRPPKSLKIVDYILLAGTLVLVASQFISIYYYYDENNVYHRATWYPISYAVPFLAMIVLVSIITRHRKSLSKRLFAPLVLFAILPLVASVFHFFFHKFTFTTGSVVGMTVLLYCFSILDANEIMKTAHEKEVANTKLMIEQTALALAEAIDAKDAYTSGHSRRVAELSAKIAEKAGKDKEYCEEIYLTGLLHDVGKIGVPNAIINKETKLTDEEYEVIKTHPVRGKEILSKISISPNLPIGANYHHERYDGKGYPEGLKGQEIPEIARIIAVADTYDAMASRRSYRNSLPMEKIRDELIKGMGKQFDTKFANIMVDMIDSGEVH